jgi:hypothetical protein
MSGMKIYHLAKIFQNILKLFGIEIYHLATLFQSKMLSLGRSKPWQDALEELTGTREMSVRPILEVSFFLHSFVQVFISWGCFLTTSTLARKGNLDVDVMIIIFGDFAIFLRKYWRFSRQPLFLYHIYQFYTILYQFLYHLYQFLYHNGVFLDNHYSYTIFE